MNLNTTLKSLALTLSMSVIATAAQADFVGKVVRISDGDTITVLNNNNEQIRVRFNQIDAPEKVKLLVRNRVRTSVSCMKRLCMCKKIVRTATVVLLVPFFRCVQTKCPT